jgi:hypothetical protein
MTAPAATRPLASVTVIFRFMFNPNLLVDT